MPLWSSGRAPPLGSRGSPGVREQTPRQQTHPREDSKLPGCPGVDPKGERDPSHPVGTGSALRCREKSHQLAERGKEDTGLASHV